MASAGTPALASITACTKASFARAERGTFPACTPHPQEHAVSQRLDFYKASPKAIKAMMGLEQHINQSALEHSLIELVRLRASQINGCAFCMDMHSADAAKAGEDARRLATLSA